MSSAVEKQRSPSEGAAVKGCTLEKDAYREWSRRRGVVSFYPFSEYLFLFPKHQKEKGLSFRTPPFHQ